MTKKGVGDNCEPFVTDPFNEAIVLHVHSAIEDRRFVPLVEERLRALFTAPVRTQASHFDLEPLTPMIGKIDANALVHAYASTAVDWRGQISMMHFFIHNQDMRLSPARYNFAVAIGDATTAFHLGIVSIARLQEVGLLEDGDPDPVLTASWVFKLVAKNTAKMAGYRSSRLCLFAFPNSLPALDSMPESFCEPDSGRLVEAGLLHDLDAQTLRH